MAQGVTDNPLLPCDKCGREVPASDLRRSSGGNVFCRECMPQFFEGRAVCRVCGRKVGDASGTEDVLTVCEACAARQEENRIAAEKAQGNAVPEPQASNSGALWGCLYFLILAALGIAGLIWGRGMVSDTEDFRYDYGHGTMGR